MIRNLTIFVFLIFFVGCAGMAQKGALGRAYSNYKKGDYEDVLALTSQAEQYKEPSHELKAEILFLRALALEKLGRDEEAQGTFKFVSTKFSDTEYGFRAKEKIR